INDLIGYLSFVSPDPNTLINYVLDTTRYSNRYFRISNDSLILNTDEDLSAITDLKINVIAVDCDADTFSQTFSLLFDTTVMKFRYNLPDTVISIYSDYVLSIDSLIDDYSKHGISMDVNIENAGIVTYSVFNDSIAISPVRVGKSTITLIASDQFTGKNYQKVFRMEVFDPLNHDPYHPDSAMTDFIVQLNDTTVIPLARIFIDPDNDLPDYWFGINDTAIVTGWLQDHNLFLEGLKTGIAHVAVIADDRRGGLDSISLNIRVNSAPFHIDTITLRYIIQLNERLLLNMQDVFHDSDNDSLSFDYLQSDPALLEVFRVGDSLNILGIVPGISDLAIIADDDHGGTDTLWYSLFINSRPLRIKEYSALLYQFVPGCADINLDSIFADPDSDTVTYHFFPVMDSMSIDDSNQLILCPENPGIYKVYLSLTDNKGGSFADSIEARFNASPEALQLQYQFTYEAAQEQIIMDLNNIFADADDDTLGYAVTHIHNELLIYNILEDILQLYPQVADTLEFFVIASDNYGGKDSITIRLIYVPGLNAVIANRLIDNLKIFPNPASGVVHLQFESAAVSPFGIRLSDQNGRIVYQADGLKANQGINYFELNIESIRAKGLFFLTLDMDDGQLIINSIIIE
ncbi:MAG TPA: T9SS type A sorting domain-containing protein, partial [Bacteroidales bacterium]|nr:T9SS type A sorting domain-containing protein [Bacteroidales bacterium]